MISKKAFEIQFNWVFVLVAGTAILLFFAFVIAKQKSAAETSTKSTVLKNIEAIVTGAGIGTGTTNIIPVPDSNIEVGCNRISVGGVSKQYQSLILFATGLIRGSKIVTQTLDFSVPYRATNLLYMTSQQARYIIIGNNNLARDVNRTMPSALKKEFYSEIPAIENKNNYNVKLLVFGDIGMGSINIRNLEKMPDSDVTAIKVDGDDQKGIIEFYQKDGNLWLSKGRSSYIGEQSLIGAVYADSADAYECNMQNAFARLNLVTKIYIERTSELGQSNFAGMPLRCSDVYNNALTYLNRIYESSSTFSEANVNAIASAAASLANENKNAQIYSCTLIY